MEKLTGKMKAYDRVSAEVVLNGKHYEIVPSILYPDYDNELNILLNYRSFFDNYKKKTFITGGTAKKLLLHSKLSPLLKQSNDADGIYLDSGDNLKRNFPNLKFKFDKLIDKQIQIEYGINNCITRNIYSPFGKYADRGDKTDVFTKDTGQGSIPINGKIADKRITVNMIYVKNGKEFDYKFNVDSLPHLIAITLNPLSTPLEENGKRFLPMLYILSQFDKLGVNINNEIKDSMIYLKSGSKTVGDLIESSDDENIKSNKNYTDYKSILRDTIPNFEKRIGTSKVERYLKVYNIDMDIKPVLDSIDYNLKDYLR